MIKSVQRIGLLLTVCGCNGWQLLLLLKIKTQGPDLNPAPVHVYMHLSKFPVDTDCDDIKRDILAAV